MQWPRQLRREYVVRRAELLKDAKDRASFELYDVKPGPEPCHKTNAKNHSRKIAKIRQHVAAGVADDLFVPVFGFLLTEEWASYAYAFGIEPLQRACNEWVP